MDTKALGKILVVDDEVELKNILVEAFTLQGYLTSGFTTGEAALEALRCESFDILLTDLMMPGMDGITLARESLQIDPHLVAIMMTGEGTIQTAVDAMKVGAFDYVLKPFRLQSVLLVLTRAMNTRHMRLENMQLRETVAIYELAQTIAFTLDPQTLLSKVADAALQQTHADEVSILLPTSDGTDQLYVAAVRGEKRRRLLGERVSLEESISGWVAREKEPLMLEGAIKDDRFRSLWPRPEIRAALSIPMLVANRLIGTINVNAVNRPRPFTLGQKKALTILASTAAAALESASLYTQLQKAEENYRSIFENAVEGIFQSTPEGRFITMNPAMADILGYASPAAAVAGITDIKHQIYVDPGGRSESDRIQAEQGFLQGYEFEAYRKDGERIWLSVNRRSIRDQDDIEIYREGFVKNITTRKRAEEALRETVRSKDESLAVLDTILSTAPIGFAFHNRDLVYERINESLAAINGLPVEAHIGRTVREVLPEMAAALEPHLKRVVETGLPTIDLELSGETQADPGNQHYWLASFYPVQMKGGEVLGVGVLVSDITERKRAEEALRESELRYKGLIDSAFDGVVIHRGGAIVSANRAFVEMFGYSADEVIGMDVLDFTAPECRDFVRGHTQDESTYESFGLRKEGSRMPVETSGHICLYEGQTARLAAIRDITERKRVEQIQTRRAALALFRADVSAALAASHAPLRATLELCTAAMVQHLGAAFARIWTLNHEGDVLELQASSGIYTHIDGAHGRVPVGSFKIGKIAQERLPHITNDVRSDPRVSDKDWARREGMVAFAGYPLLLEDRLIGVMALFSRRELSEDTLDALASVAALMSQGIDLRRAEKALQDSERRKDAILKTALDCVITIDHEGVVIDFNPAAERTFGYASADVVGKKKADLIVPILLPPDHEHGFARYMATGGSSMLGKRMEVTAVRADGNEIPVELTITAIGELPHPTFTAFIRDLTEPQRAETELRQSEERYRDMVENARDMIYSHDLEGNYTSMNTAGEKIMGYPRAEVLTLNLAQTVAPECVVKVEEMLTRKLAGEDVTNYEIEIIAKDGRRVPVEANTRLVYQDGVPVGVQGIARDVTVRKQLEEQLRQSQKMEAIGQLAGGVAHDFNNLLTAINGYASLTLQQLEANHPLRSYLEEIKKAGDRAASLTRQLLAFGRKQILQPRALNLNDIVSDMNKMLRRLIGEDIRFATKLASKLKPVRADPGQIEQVLLNLVVNARDSMPQGGSLTIETDNVELDREYANQHVGVQPGHFAVLAVSDTGTGMDEETQSRIFEPFFTTKAKDKGTGLGLSTVYGIVKQSGGNIWVYSEPGHGTALKVYFPALDSPQEQLGHIPAESEVRGGSETILLVEDEEIVRRLARRILEQTGYEVLEASHGEEAVRLCGVHAKPIHLLLTDVVMPGTSGKEVADRLSSMRPEIKVLFMSGYTDEAIVHQGVLNSSVEFIQKPFTLAALSRKVREVLDSNGNARALQPK
jgi:PAS domain S-box-containing protein